MNIVKFDAVANYVDPRFEVKGYPALYWVTKDGKIKQYNVIDFISNLLTLCDN